MIALLWLACRGPACVSTADCGFGETCDAGTCEGRNCATSAQCGMETYCAEDGHCLPGCALDTDCLAGDSCDAGVCTENSCVDTRVDCGYREHCTDGSCVDAGEPHCAACTTDDECGAANLCWVGEWCAVDCSDGSECPGGFECLEVTDDGGEVHQVCITSCWLFQERG